MIQKKNTTNGQLCLSHEVTLNQSARVCNMLLGLHRRTNTGVVRRGFLTITLNLCACKIRPSYVLYFLCETDTILIVSFKKAN